MPKELAHFDASRLKVKPMAIGRIPPDFLFSAKRRPPKKTGAITGAIIIIIIFFFLTLGRYIPEGV